MADVPALHLLIEASVRTLQAADYSPHQLEGALGSVFGVDSQLIADQTYFLVETSSFPAPLACGGWSFRQTLFGSDRDAGRDDRLLNPAVDAARIRAFFVHPAWTRRGLASLMLTAAESAASAAGFRDFELGATLTGIPFYLACGYQPIAEQLVGLPNGAQLPIMKMQKRAMR